MADISNINSASVQNEPSQFQVAGVNEAEIKTRANEAEKMKEKAVSMSTEEALAVASFLEEYMTILQTSIGFSVNESVNRIVITVTNKDTNEVIRQIPSEEMIELQEKMKELTGLIFSKSV